MRTLQYVLWSILGFIVTSSVVLLYYAIIAQSDFWGERLPGLIFLNIIVGIGLAIGASAVGEKANAKLPIPDPHRKYLQEEARNEIVKGRVIEQRGYNRSPGNPEGPGRYED